jgi:hypothetical protein
MLSRTNAAIFPDTPRMRTLMAIVVLASFGCGIAVVEASAQPAPNTASAGAIPNPVPLPRPRPKMGLLPSWIATLWREPTTFREAAGEDFKTADVTSAPSACRTRLEKFAVVAAMPRLIGPGACGGGDIVRIDAVLLSGGKKIEIKPAPYLQCPMAEQLALWLRDDAVPLTAASGVLQRLETYDDFDCRGRNRKMSGKVSEHGKANAIDLKGFTFEGGRYIHLTDIKADKPLREAARRTACARFTTVLGPGSDGYHEEHIHLDLAERSNGYRICQWDVREPPPPPKVPEKTPEKPPEAAPEKPAEVAAAPMSEPAAAPAEPDGDEDEKVVATMVSPIQGVVPLPKPRPALRRHAKRKTRDLFHFPFTLSR